MKKNRIHKDWTFWKDGHENEKMTIMLPHDAMMLESRDPDMENGSGTAYYPGGKYYYEKKMWGKEEYENQSLIIEFEGVYMNSSVYLNGERVGGWIYGYTNFFVDITGKLKTNEENILLVEADNSLTPNSRWYSGSGIYRPVNLWIGGVCYIQPQGVQISTISIQPAVISVSTNYTIGDLEVWNSASANMDITVEYQVYDGDKEIAVASGKKAEITIQDARLWSAETPYLYCIRTILKHKGNIVDTSIERFGIRTLSWNENEGLLVNQNTVKLKGGCIHHDNGILGACSFDKAEYRRIKKMKEFGFNAIRYSHYPAGKNLLDVCDELGMYILDESFDQWRGKNTLYDYHIYFDKECEKDLTALANKDYNHPSVIMYCIGNEITDTGRSYAPGITWKLCNAIHQVDKTRPITIANNAPMSIIASEMEKMETQKNGEIGSVQINELLTAHPELQKSFERGAFGADKLEAIVGKVFDEVDIAGHNYANDFYEGIHKIRPDRILLSTETFPSRMATNWKDVKEKDYVIGDFHWAAWDYLGEAGVGVPTYGTKEASFTKPYPCLTASCGSFDLIGIPEAAAYYTAIIWGEYKKPYIGVRPVNHSGEEYTIGQWRLTDAMNCWTWKGCEGKEAEVIIYSIGKEIELYINGSSIGRKKLVDCKAEYNTCYKPGTIEAVSYNENGTEIGRTQLQTAEDKVCLVITSEDNEVKADIDEIFYVIISLTDDKGILQQMLDKKIAVTVEGEGELIALGSGCPETAEKFSAGTYTSWHGYVLGAIRCSGKSGNIKVTATAEGCETVSVKVQAREKISRGVVL